MLRTTKLLFIAVVVALAAFGCSNQGDQINPLVGPGYFSLAAGFMDGTAIQSATLYVYVNTPSGQDITVHRVTADWDEMSVTWSSFAGAFDAAVAGGFASDATGWKTSDVTALVQTWLDGDNPNFGVLLKQGGELVPRSHFASRESDNVPMLEICYSTDAGPECLQFTSIADASLMENYPNDNTGSLPEMFCGYYSIETLEKQALIRFELPSRPETASIGDFVWFDDNEDGIQGAGEAGFAGATVNLFNCQGVLIATTMTDFSGYYLFDNLTAGDYNVGFVIPEDYAFSPQDMGMDDALDSDADPATGMTTCTTLEPGEHDATWDAGLYLPVEDDCGECDGKITSLTLEYQGSSEAMVEVLAKGKKRHPGEVLYSGQVLPGGNFTVDGYDKHGTLGTEIKIIVNGCLRTKIHTSCSKPIFIGMVSGDFRILDGYSRNGGRLCEGEGDGGGGDGSSECDGKITNLALEYQGSTEALVEIFAKGKKRGHGRHGRRGERLFSGQVSPGGSFSIAGNDKHGTVGTEITILVDGNPNTKIHTSCSRPIYIGMVSGDFEILDGYSRNGGQLPTE